MVGMVVGLSVLVLGMQSKKLEPHGGMDGCCSPGLWATFVFNMDCPHVHQELLVSKYTR